METSRESEPPSADGALLLRRVGRGWASLTIVLLACAIISGRRTAGPAHLETSQNNRPVFRLDLNRATAPQLEVLPGIGPTMAARIIAYRETHGPFRRLQDLLDVHGIGERTLERISPYLFIEQETSNELIAGTSSANGPGHPSTNITEPSP